MPDPTAPPAQLPSATAGTSALQAILSSRERAPAAVIDGRTVTLGDWVGPAKLIRIGADHVVLQGPQGRQTLRLLEGIRPQRSSKVSRPTSP
jgi:MSHA biogenesis protein MshK